MSIVRAALAVLTGAPKRRSRGTSGGAGASLPPGAARLWLRIRHGEDVFGRLLEVLQAASTDSVHAMRPIVWDLARASVRAARAGAGGLVEDYAVRRRGADLALVERRASEAIYRVLMDDLTGERRLTGATLATRARRRFESLARAELVRR